MVGSMAADPAMVLAHGDGLERGSCGIKPTKVPPRGTWHFHLKQLSLLSIEN